MRKIKVEIIICLVVLAIVPSVQGKSASVLLQEGIYAEEITGDLDKAIDIYQEIISDSRTKRGPAAQAIYRLGVCYMKQEERQKAKAAFKSLVSLYPEQVKLIEKVKPILATLIDYDPASIMPADTLLYIEVGDPGKQIETILKMLKGTPLANPMAMMGGGNGQAMKGNPIGAILNPSMMSEFKKIRGFAVGLTDVSNNNPPIVAVLYPGESDALRGILLGILGMQGKQVDGIEGMSVLNIGGVGVAHDDTVIIIVNPMEQLERTVKRYKGTSGEATLISKNKSFSELSMQKRAGNTLTVWADTDVLCARIEKLFGGNIPSEYAIANMFGDFKNIDETIAYLNVGENEIFIEIDTNFKDGHNCLAYDIIRTPNLSKGGFEGVPSEAIGLVSLALGDADSAFAGKVQDNVKRFSGLDIGRELFANIEQVNLFVLGPADGVDKSFLAQQISPVINRVGLSITSNNPVKTREVLGKLLTAGNATVAGLSGSALAQPSGPLPSKYAITMMNKEFVYCYMDQSGKSTMLSLNPDVFSAVKRRKSVLSGGPLHLAVSDLSSDTSKVVLVNAGGAIRTFGAHMNRFVETTQGGEGSFLQVLDQLAQTFDKTNVEFNMKETDNRWRAHLGVSNLPALEGVFPLVMQVQALASKNFMPQAVSPNPGNRATIGPNEKVKLSWARGVNAVSHKIYYGMDKKNLSLLGETSELSYDTLPAVKEGSTVYWRVDEIEGDGSVIAGKLWSFSGAGMVGRWEFEEGDGDIANDSSKKDHPGLLKGPTWHSEGKTGKALKFDGIDDYVDVSGFSVTTNNATFTAWIKGWKASYWAGIVHSHTDYVTGMYFGGNNTLHYCWNKDAQNTWAWNDGPVIPEDEWAFIAVTIEPDRATAYVYTDAGGMQSSVNAIPHFSQTIGNLQIGKDGRYTTRYFKGLIDDVRVYNYALSASEIAELVK